MKNVTFCPIKNERLEGIKQAVDHCTHMHRNLTNMIKHIFRYFHRI